MRDLKKYTRICIGCGKVMENVGNTRKRCPECSRKYKSQMSIKYYRENYNAGIGSDRAVRKNAEASAEESSRALIADNDRFVASAGSYGKGRLKEYLEAQKKRPVGAGTPASQGDDGLEAHHPDDTTKSEDLTR